MTFQIPQHLRREALDTQNQVRLERYREKLASAGNHPLDMAGFPAWSEAEHRPFKSMATKVIRPSNGGAA